MDKMIQVFLDKSEIVKRLAICTPSIEYELEGGDMDYVLVFKDVDEDDAKTLDELFEDEAYGDGEMTLAETLVALLEDAGINIATAESCTGGMVASAIVDVSGASGVFYEGLVTYSNNSKIDRLGVGVDTLYERGAVSEETAVEMADGLLRDSVALGVSTTGIAGPQGGTPEKPVGLVYIAVVSEKHTDVYKNIFAGDRNAVRRQARNAALFYAIRHIKKYF
jgi:competence/damage-inducible protein CinA C-terminal domain